MIIATMATETISVHILDKDYQVACPTEQRDSLVGAASELDRRMRDIRQSGSVVGVERIAVMAALNLAYEVLNSAQKSPSLDQSLIDDMHHRIETILAN